jgi:hypothetical protein
MDFAGIARLFSTTGGEEQPAELWYLVGAWLLAATMNAILTWWAVSLALLEHRALGNEILARETLIHSVPVYVAVLVWLLRILLIGTFSLSMNARRMGQRRPILGHPGRTGQPTGHKSKSPKHASTKESRPPIRPAPKPSGNGGQSPEN